MHYFIHLLNDLSGSPRIINEKIKCYRAQGIDCLVVTNDGRGFIELEGQPHHVVPYCKNRNILLWIFSLLRWHLSVFWFLIRAVGPADVVHASTMLTAPHLLAARLKGARTVAHLMETRVSPALHGWLVKWLIISFADRIVFLSHYVSEALGSRFSRKPNIVTYPCIDARIVEAARAHVGTRTDTAEFVVGQVCSLVWYKGYRQFISLARECPDIQFKLVLNGNAKLFFAEYPRASLPGNFDVEFDVRDIASVLSTMDMLISLTQRTGWIETFGLTIVEGMTFGLPVIAPDIGAPREYVRHEQNGFLVDETSLSEVAAIIRRVQGDRKHHRELSQAAVATARRFAPESFAIAVQAERAFVVR